MIGPELLLGPSDEPQQSGAAVAVHYGDYRRQEIWVRSGANIGCWYPLGGEFGRPKVWRDPRSEAERMAWRLRSREPGPKPGSDEVPLHPHWEDVLARGPVVALLPGSAAAYREGWRNGRRLLSEQVESLAEETPEDPEW